MTAAQINQATIALRAFASSGWFQKMLGPKQQSAIRVALWALDQVAQAMAKEAA